MEAEMEIPGFIQLQSVTDCDQIKDQVEYILRKLYQTFIF